MPDDIMEMMKRSKNGTGNSDFDKIKLEGLRGFACSPNTAFQGSTTHTLLCYNCAVALHGTDLACFTV